MIVRTGLKSGNGVEETAMTDSLDSSRSKPFINKWYTCDHCKGTRDQNGNVSQATCNSCWPGVRPLR
jgi:hypothetical protein